MRRVLAALQRKRVTFKTLSSVKTTIDVTYTHILVPSSFLFVARKSRDEMYGGTYLFFYSTKIFVKTLVLRL
jgi:hypothetical protein